MEACNEYVDMMERRMHASQESEIKRLLEELEAGKEANKRQTGAVICMKEEWQRATFEAEVKSQRAKIAELKEERDQDIRRASRVARREIAEGYKGFLASLEEKWEKKKKEAAAITQLQEVVANIDLLNEIRGGGLVVERSSIV